MLNPIVKKIVSVLLVTVLSSCGSGGSDRGAGSSGSTLVNIAPTANAGADRTVDEELLVTLNGVASSDSDGNITNYNWVQTAGGNVSLSDVTAVSPTFIAAADSPGGRLAFELTVIDNDGAQHTDTVTITIITSSSNTYSANLAVSGQFKDAVLINRNPDCRAYATDANGGNYGSNQITDISNSTADGVSLVQIDMVVASNWNATLFNYDNVTETLTSNEATHCRMISNMIPNHTFGVDVTGPGGQGWINPIDHSDLEVTYIPVNPVKTNIAADTPRNPPVFDFDGILLNGVGISMDSGFCYHPGVTSGPLSLRSNAAGNTSGCGPRNTWFELPAYTIWYPAEQNMAAIFDNYFAHGFGATYHYHAMTHPLQEDDDQTQPPSNGSGSPVIGFAPDGFPIYGHWFVDENNIMVMAESGYETTAGNSRMPNTAALNGTPPTPWDIANNPDDFDSDFGLELGRYEEDWYYAGSGNLDACNGAFDINGDYGYYITDKYPFTPPCTFGVRDPSFGKVAPTLP